MTFGRKYVICYDWLKYEIFGRKYVICYDWLKYENMLKATHI